MLNKFSENHTKRDLCIAMCVGMEHLIIDTSFKHCFVIWCIPKKILECELYSLQWFNFLGCQGSHHPSEKKILFFYLCKKSLSTAMIRDVLTFPVIRYTYWASYEWNYFQKLLGNKRSRFLGIIVQFVGIVYSQ